MAFTKIVGAGIHTLSNVHTHNINSSGIITATNFVGPFDGTTGDFSGNVTIGGNLVVNGDTTTLNTTLREVELLRVDSTNNSVAAGIITQRGSGNILDLYDTGSAVFSVRDGGNIIMGTGAGSVAPHAPLHIRTGTTGAITTLLKLHGPFTSNTGSEGTAIDFGTASDTSTGARIIGTRQAAGAKGALRFCTGRENDAGFNDGHMMIDETGKVGIGTDLPDYPLDVIGSIGFSGQTRAASGSQGAPSYSFDGDSDTGVFRNGVNNLSFATGGTQRFFVDPAGNVTFNGGTSVSGIASVHNTLQFTTTGGAHIDHKTTNQNLNFRVTKSSTADTNMMQINAASEQTKFHKQILLGLQGGGDTTIIGGGSGIGAYIQLNYANNNIVNTKLLGNNTSWLNSHYGNLGIGTQTANEKFQVRTGTNKFISFTDAEHGSLSDLGSAIIFSRPSNGATKICGIFQHTNQSLAIAARDNLTFHTGGNAFYYSGTEKLRITSDGVLKITGQTSTLETAGLTHHTNNNLYIRGGTTGAIIQSVDGNEAWIVQNDYVSASTAGAERLRIKSTGEVGIGTDNPKLKLHVHQNNSNASFTHFTNTSTGYESNQGLSVGIDSDENAVMYHYGSKNIRFATANTQHMVLRSTGQLGIGTALTPSADAKKLTLLCDSVGDGIWIANKENLYSAASTGYSDLRFTFRDYLVGGYTQGGESIIRAYSENAYATQRRTALIFMNSDNVGAGGTAYEKMRLSSYGQLSLAGDTDTYIHHPEDNELAITVSGGSAPIIRFGTGGNNATVGIKTDTCLVTNGEALSVRGYSSFKSLNDGYAAIYTHNEEQGNTTIASHILFNVGGANRGGFGYDTDNSTLIMGNQTNISFTTGSTQLGGTERLRITTDKVMFSADAKVDTTNTRDLGADGAKWKTLYLGTQLNIDATSSTEMIMLDAGGTNFAKIGHNTSSGSNMLDVRSEGHMRFLTNGNNERLRIRSGGQVAINNDTGSVLELTRTTSSVTALCGKIVFGNTNWDSSMASIQSYQDGANDNANLRFYTQAAVGAGELERLRINAAGQILKRQDPVNRTSLKTYSGEGLWFDHYQLQAGSTYRRYADIAAVGDGSWGSILRLHTMSDGGSATERLRITQDGQLKTNCDLDSDVKLDVDDSIWWWNTNTGLAPNTSRTWTITGIYYGGAKIVIGGGDGNLQRAGAVIEVVGTMWSTSKVYYHHETIKSSSGASISTTYNNNSIAITVASSSNWWYYSMTIEQSKRSGSAGVSVTVS